MIKPLKGAFDFGTEEETKFRYVGLHIKQTEDGITVDHHHYLTAMEEPDLGRIKDLKNGDVLDGIFQSEFWSAVARLATVAFTS